jgi:uncharacterized protein (DUF488 family)
VLRSARFRAVLAAVGVLASTETLASSMDFETVFAPGRAHVRRVRVLPLSRRRGFSKTPLNCALAAQGIEYVHVRAAGNPYRNLRDDPERCLALYAEHLDEHPAVLVEVEEALNGTRSALLCMEASHERCHRSVIAERLMRRGVRRTVTHL